MSACECSNQSLTDMPIRPRVIVTGASGLLGRAVMRAFQDCDVTGVALRRADPSRNIVPCDLTNEVEARNLIMRIRPSHVIHCAAERRPDVCDKDTTTTVALNVRTTTTLVTAAREVGAWFVYVSTDYVFDGTSPPYSPSATPNPLSFYGKTKLEGEVITRTLMPDAGIIRVPILYGPIETLEESAITILVKNVINRTPAEIDDWQIRYPTHVDDVAAAIRALCAKKIKHCGLQGLWHFSGSERMTKYDIARTIGEVLGIPTDHLVPNKNAPPGAPRPHDAQLDTTALRIMGLIKTTPFREGIAAALAPFRDQLPK